jgi:hypothetical protein
MRGEDSSDCVVSVRQCWIGFGTGFRLVEKLTTELDWRLPARGHPAAIDQEEKHRGALSRHAHNVRGASLHQ